MSPRSRPRPDRCLEKDLLQTHEYVGGLDEVGRGALAGPASVGLAIVGRCTDDDFPEGLADSKQLTARARTALVDYALTARLVTIEDLPLLDQEAQRSRQELLASSSTSF